MLNASLKKRIKRLIKRIIIMFSPRWWVIAAYRNRMKKKLNLEKPVTYSEKIQFRKLYEKDKRYTKLADKVAVRDYLKQFMKEDIEQGILNLPKIYGIYKKPEEIDFDKLPNSFVLKPNHASGEIIICRDKSRLIWDKEVKRMKNWLKLNFYYVNAEWQYKDIKPQIICEELLDEDIIDYRIFCFKGEPYFTKVTRHNYEDSKHPYFYNTYYNDWSEVEIEWNKSYIKEEFEKPEKWEHMLDISRKLSEKFEFVRIDLYIVNKKVYFSEFTFTPNSGFEPSLSEEWDILLGNKFDIVR